MAETIRRWLIPGAGLAIAWAVLAALCLPMMPNAAGRLGGDYNFWLPNLLAGAYFHAQSPFWAVAWFTPATCAGVPLHADPQGAYLSLPQFLTFVMPPVRAIQSSMFAYAGAGFAGMWVLARRRFACSEAASLVAATLFALNGLFSARMMVGHLSFGPFMLVPAMAACALQSGGGWRRTCGAIIGFGVFFAITIQAGMAVLVPPSFLALAMLILLHALFPGAEVRRSAMLAAAGTALGLALCAGKLAAVVALLAHMPRDLYPLPGFRNVEAVWIAVRSVFLFPSAAMNAGLVNSALTLDQHEYDYRIGPAPLILLGWAAVIARRSHPEPFTARRRVLWECLLLCALLPVALNTYYPNWTALLKLVPILRSSSSLLRWFAAYIPVAAIVAGLALDRVTRRPGAAPWLLAGGAIALTCLGLFESDHSVYGPAGAGVYDPAPIEAAWHRLASTGQVEPIRALAVPRDEKGAPDMSLGRENLMTQGASPLFCYDPLFGYRLESFRQGTLHAGPVLDETQAGARRELNLKNPACYVYPGANACVPGDTFLASQRSEAEAFAAYRPFTFAKPGWARLADWIGIVTAGLVAPALLVLAWPRRRRHAA